VRPRYKFIAQFALSLVLLAVTTSTETRDHVSLPAFFKRPVLDLGVLYIPSR
jgi:hypothetical protein